MAELEVELRAEVPIWEVFRELAVELAGWDLLRRGVLNGPRTQRLTWNRSGGGRTYPAALGPDRGLCREEIKKEWMRLPG